MIFKKLNGLTAKELCLLIAIVIFSVAAAISITIEIEPLFNSEYKKFTLQFIYILFVFIFIFVIVFIFNFLSSKDSPLATNQHYTKIGNSSSKSETEDYQTQLDCIYAREYRQRLQSHIDKIRDNSVINLLTGLVVSASGVVFIFFYHEDNEYISRIKDNIVPFYFFSKLFAVLFIELLAFFFLKLYKQNLHDIKYFQNELANIDSKLIALNFSIKTDDKKIYYYVLKQLGKTDRNHILKKGESTIELEKMKFDKNDYQSLVDLITRILKTKPRESSNNDIT